MSVCNKISSFAVHDITEATVCSFSSSISYSNFKHPVILLQAQECENLMRVVRELTASRSKLVAGKSVMAERFAELQAEYIKVLRIAELSRAASRSNLAKADKATNLAKQVC